MNFTILAFFGLFSIVWTFTATKNELPKVNQSDLVIRNNDANATGECQMAVIIALTQNSLPLLKCMLNPVLCPKDGGDPLGPLAVYLDTFPNEKHRVRPMEVLFILPYNAASSSNWSTNATELAEARARGFEAIAENTLPNCDKQSIECQNEVLLDLIFNAFFAYSLRFANNASASALCLQIAVFTDYVDRKLGRHGSDIAMYPMQTKFYIPPHNGQVANYYHFVLGGIDDVHILDSNNSIGVPFVTPATDVDTLLNRRWHLIYVLALTNKISQAQFEGIKRSIREPIEEYLKQHPDAIEVSVFAPNGSMDCLDSCNCFYRTPTNNIGQYLSDSLQWEQSVLKDESWFNLVFTTFAMLNSVSCYMDQLGSRLRHVDEGQVNTALGRPYVQRQPRIYLITNYFEQYLHVMAQVAHLNVPDEMAELHIYAANPPVQRQYSAFYRDSARVFDYDPDHPSPVRIETPAARSLLVYIVAGAALAIIAVSVVSLLTAFFYRRRLKWIERVNRLYADHRHTSQMANKSAQRQKLTDAWELSWQDVALKERIGSGAFGQVHRAVLFDTQTSKSIEIAVKMLPIYSGEKAKKEFVREIEMMKFLPPNEHLVNLIGCISSSCVPPEKPCLAMEYCANGNLLTYVRRMNTTKDASLEKRFAMFAWQICAGMQFLHHQSIIHRDLAARNVLLDEELKVKIGDIGHCLRMPSNELDNNGPLPEQSVCSEFDGEATDGVRRFPVNWLAPECQKGRQFSAKSDVWSFGVLLFEMHSFGEAPFAEIEPKQLHAHLESGNRLRRPGFCSDKIWETMQMCWDYRVEERPSSSALLQMFTALLEQMTEHYGYV